MKIILQEKVWIHRVTTIWCTTLFLCLKQEKYRMQRERLSNIWKRKTKYACIVDADESTRPRLEGAVHKHHQDHITAKGMNSLNHCSLVHKFIPMPQALKNTECQDSSGKSMEKTGENTGMAADECQEQK